jgi:dihydrofolate synthase/folylpolyglutamate synthase
MLILKKWQTDGKDLLPCRFEKIQDSPLIIADGAHNLDSIQKLIFLFNRFYGNREIICVFGASADKKCNEMINELAPNVSRFIVTRSTHPRAAIPKDLRDMEIRCGKHVQLTDQIEEAYDIICNSRNDGIYIVTGSLFVAAGFREIVMQQKGNLPYFT